jgi:hypothetical protein
MSGLPGAYARPRATEPPSNRSQSAASGLMRSPGRTVSLQTAFLNEARADRRHVRLAIAQRVRRGVDRVAAEDEIVRVRSG